jgi:AcrR family transcriptional regulator
MRIRKSAEERKVEILDAVLRLADRLGPDRLSTEAITREVGLTQPAIFRHFPTKRDIWAKVAATISDQMIAGWRAVLDRDRGPIEGVRGLILAQLRLIESTPAIPAILFSRELHAENDLLRTAVFELMGKFHQAIAAEVTGAVKEGTFRRDLDPGDAAFLLIGLVQGLVLRWSLSRRSFGLQSEGARLLDLQIGLFRRSSEDKIEGKRNS